MSAPEVPATPLPSGERIPVLGQGTWHMAEERQRRDDEIAALRLGLDLGMTLIDTAESYAAGGSEKVVAEAIAGRRDEVFLVTKVSPGHATARGTAAACEASLRRLRTDRIDLYLLHWPSAVPLQETIDAFNALVQAGKIRHWGVSNFDTAEMSELAALPGGDAVQTDQVLYNLGRRAIEAGLLPWCRERRILIMAYSPIGGGRLSRHPALESVAARHGVSRTRVALAWVLRQDGVCAIPKASSADHVRDNRAALDLHLSAEDLAELDRAFPPPTEGQPPLATV